MRWPTPELFYLNSDKSETLRDGAPAYEISIDWPENSNQVGFGRKPKPGTLPVYAGNFNSAAERSRTDEADEALAHTVEFDMRRLSKEELVELGGLTFTHYAPNGLRLLFPDDCQRKVEMSYSLQSRNVRF